MWNLTFRYKGYFVTREDPETYREYWGATKRINVDFERIAPIVQLMNYLCYELIKVKQIEDETN